MGEGIRLAQDLVYYVASGPVWLEYLSTKLSISTTIWQMAEGIINHC